ncbi:MAG: hypothetical protein AAGD07_19970 [Planctomycetota bacterium]
MNDKLRKRLAKRKRRLRRRISVEQGRWQSPMIKPGTTKLELAERQQAVSCGGIAMIMQMLKTIDLRRSLNESAKVFKLHMPYDEADHILNIALNTLAGGTCLDQIEQRRNDEAYLDAVGAQRIPDPTTAGDFCRRFSNQQCREAGFRKIVLRGDTDFSSTEHLDRWDREGVKFVLGYDANKKGSIRLYRG